MKNEALKPFGYYLIVTECGKRLFVKVVEESAIARQQQASLMAEWLFKQGIETSVVIDEKRALFDDKAIALFVFDALDARFANTSVDDLALIGKALYKLHQALKKCPWQVKIHQESLERHRSLSEALALLKEGSSLKHTVPCEVNKIFESVSSNVMSQLTENAQVVHGDLNHGNLMITSEKKVIFLDFEDTWSAFFSPLMELSFMIERFALIESNKGTHSLATALLDGYYHQRKMRSPWPLDEMLKALAIRAMLILAMQSQRKKIAKSEWDKFIYLYKQANKRQELLREITKSGY